MSTLDLILRIISTVATLMIGVAASLLAYRQYRISQSKLKLDLYEKRLALFRVAVEFANDLGQRCYKESSDIIDRSLKFRSDTLESRFLFDNPDVPRSFDQLYEEANSLAALVAVWQTPKALPLPEDQEEQLQRSLAMKTSWFLLQESFLVERFTEDLSIRTLH